jgi:prevent-host-death family protein
MPQVTIHEAKTHLSRLIRQTLRGEEVIISRGNQPLVKLMPIVPRSAGRRLGGCKDLVVHMSDDFDEPLDDFEEYM